MSFSSFISVVEPTTSSCHPPHLISPTFMFLHQSSVLLLIARLCYLINIASNLLSFPIFSVPLLLHLSFSHSPVLHPQPPPSSSPLSTVLLQLSWWRRASRVRLLCSCWKGRVCVCVSEQECMSEWRRWWGSETIWHGHPSTASVQRASGCHRDFSRARPHQLSAVENWDITTYTPTNTNTPPTVSAAICPPPQRTHTHTHKKLNNPQTHSSFSSSHNKDTKEGCVFWSPVEHDAKVKK